MSAIVQYINLSTKIFESLCDDLQDVAVLHKNIYIWGAGALTQKLLMQSQITNSFRVEGIIDNNSSYYGKSLASVPIISPDKTEPGLAIVIGSLIHQQEIHDQIAGPLHLPNLVIRLDNGRRFSELFSDIRGKSENFID